MHKNNVPTPWTLGQVGGGSFGSKMIKGMVKGVGHTGKYNLF